MERKDNVHIHVKFSVRSRRGITSPLTLSHLTPWMLVCVCVCEHMYQVPDCNGVSVAAVTLFIMITGYYEVNCLQTYLPPILQHRSPVFGCEIFIGRLKYMYHWLIFCLYLMWHNWVSIKYTYLNSVKFLLLFLLFDIYIWNQRIQTHFWPMIFRDIQWPAF